MKPVQAGFSPQGSLSWEFELRAAEELSCWQVFVLKGHENLGIEATMPRALGISAGAQTMNFSRTLPEVHKALQDLAHCLWLPFLPFTSLPLSSCPSFLALPQTRRTRSHSGPWHFDCLSWPFSCEVSCP